MSYYENHRDQMKSAAKRWRLANADRYRAYQKRYQHEKRLERCARKQLTQFLFDPKLISDEERAALLAAQANRCGICDRKRQLSADYNPLTGICRGLLCNRCAVDVAVVERYHNNLDVKAQIDAWRAK